MKPCELEIFSLNLLISITSPTSTFTTFFTNLMTCLVIISFELKLMFFAKPSETDFFIFFLRISETDVNHKIS